MEERNPTIIIPFKEVPDNPHCRDTFVYLRPESNGIEVESLIMGAIREESVCRNNVKLAYLANIPGDFILTRGLIEHHYRVRLLFALKGRHLFTKHMKKVFKSYFRCSFDKAEILDPFEAMKRLGIDEETLFKTWVKPSNMLNINGQSIKKIKNLFILNYDIPALLHKNNINTDIAVMIFRTCRQNEDVSFMIDVIENKLKEKGVVNIKNPLSRIFHYSKGPFEELLDCSGFLYDKDCNNISLDRLSFGRYLLNNGVGLEQIKGALFYPIMFFRNADGKYVENDIFSYTRGLSYKEALERFQTAYSQLVVR